MDGGGLPMVNYLLQHTLRSLCFDSQWVYAVFWRILPRNYPPPKWDTEGGILDRSKGNKRNWILVWEDGYCDFSSCGRASNTLANRCSTSASGETSEEVVGDSFQPELFFKMSHEVYNYGEGLMGKVAADNSHKWVYKEPPENDMNFLSSWHGSLDPHPRTWEAQFKSGIQTIAVVAVREGLIQLGSLHKIVEDLNFVIFLQRKFNYLQSIPGVFAMHPPLSFDLRKSKPNPSTENPWENGNHHESSIPNSNKSSSFTKDRHTQLVGMKRPPDQMLDTRMKHHGGCLSPIKAINSGWNSPQRSMISTIPLMQPSMSSLQALLSKLPSVTSPDQHATSHIPPLVLGPVSSPLMQRSSSFNNSSSSPHKVAANPLDASEVSFQKSSLTLNSTADPSSAHSNSPSDFADSKLHVLSQKHQQQQQEEASSAARRNPPIKECSRANHDQHQVHAGLCPNFGMQEFEPHADLESNDEAYRSLFNQIIS